MRASTSFHSKAADAVSAIRLIGIPKGVNTAVKRDMQVQKTGRTTDYTIGVVKDVNYRTALNYSKPGGGRGRVGFKDQVLCTRFTAGGDSGSAVCNMKGEIVGLHFAGSPSSSVFNKIANVLAALPVDEEGDKRNLAVAVYVKKKLPLAKLAAEDRVPESLSIASGKNTISVPVRVIEQGAVTLEPA